MTTTQVSRWYRIFSLHAPYGFWETTLYEAATYAYFVWLWLLVLVPLLFLACGQDLCGAFW